MVAETAVELQVALIWTAVVDDTVDVSILNVADVFPADILSGEETVPEEALLVSVTVRPPAGAGLLSVSVPVLCWPPVTDDGEMFSPASPVACTVSVAFALAPLSEADICTVVLAACAEVLMVKVEDVCPAGTFTDAGTVAAELALERDTSAPPESAGAFSVTVPVDVCPASTDAGASERPDTVIGFTVKTAETEADP
jgi:hypothetical protein